MTSWKKYKLSELCTKIGSGATPRGGSEVYKASGISLIRSQNVLDFDFSYDGLAFIDDVQAKELANVELKEKDVLVNITGDSVARVCQVPAEALPARVNQHVAIVRANSELLNPQFLKYSLLTFKSKDNLLSLASTGATRKALTKVMLAEFEIPIPNLSTQIRIASILSALDDKIELNRQMNQTLEEMARTLFNKYFVDGIDEANLAEGWRVGKLSEMHKTTSGGTPSRVRSEFYQNGVIPWVKSKELGGSFILETEELITEEALNKSSAKLLPQHSVLVAMYGATVGEIAILSSKATCNQAICAILPNEKYPYTFVFMYLKLNKGELINRASGSAQQNISQLVIQNLTLVIPPEEVIEEYHTQAVSIFARIEGNLMENRKLISLRNTLLPKLLSGEMDISALNANSVPNPVTVNTYLNHLIHEPILS